MLTPFAWMMRMTGAAFQILAEPVSKSADPMSRTPSHTIVINFPSDSFLVTQVVIGCLSSLYAFKEYVDDHIVTSILLILLGILIILIRAKFKTRTPEWVSIDPINKVMRLKQRWPLRTVIEIDISKLKLVKAFVQRFRRFPYSVVELYFNDMEKRSIFFHVQSRETRFFATPNEVVPASVEELAGVLRKIAIENGEF